MAVTRRGLGHLAFAGAVTFGTSTFLLSRQSLAEATDRAAVDQAVEALRKALLDRDLEGLRDLLADELSYGLWPGGGIQNKYEFIGHIARKEPAYTSITYSDPSITIAGNNAIVRHREAKRIVAESAICWNSASYKSGRSRTTNGGFWPGRDGSPKSVKVRAYCA